MPIVVRGIVKFCLYANPNRGKILLCSLRSEPRILDQPIHSVFAEIISGKSWPPNTSSGAYCQFSLKSGVFFFCLAGRAGNPIPERFPLGLAQKKPAPLAPARAKGPPRPTTREGRLWVSKAGRESRPHPRGWLCGCLPDSDGRLRGRVCFLSPSHPREMAESTEPHAASPWTQGSDFYRENPICTSVLK